MLADGKPVEKALTLLHFTQRSNGKQHAHGFRVITERVQDATAGAATELTKEKCYATIALCTIEKVTDFFSDERCNSHGRHLQSGCTI